MLESHQFTLEISNKPHGWAERCFLGASWTWCCCGDGSALPRDQVLRVRGGTGPARPVLSVPSCPVCPVVSVLSCPVCSVLYVLSCLSWITIKLKHDYFETLFQDPKHTEQLHLCHHFKYIKLIYSPDVIITSSWHLGTVVHTGNIYGLFWLTCYIVHLIFI